jgi:hypothetical protein
VPEAHAPHDMPGQGHRLSERPGYFLEPEAFRLSIPAFPLFHRPVLKNETKLCG